MPGFSTRIAQVLTGDGQNCKLVDPIDYVARLDGPLKGRHFRLPRGASTDGASTPKEIWMLYPPFGEYWLAAFFHDGVYHNTLMEVLPDGSLVKANLSKAEGDQMLKEMMLILGCTESTSEKFYLGVKECGWKPYKDGHA